MAQQAPFNLFLRMYPQTPGKRFEAIRAAQKLARLAYNALSAVTGVTLATPGGGQSNTLDNGFKSDFANGMAYRPQFGQSPALPSIPGFYEVDANNDPPAADKNTISGGDYREGYGGYNLVRENPTTTVANEVKALRTAIDAALATDGLTELTVFRIEYKGMVWGDRGQHFPQ